MSVKELFGLSERKTTLLDALFTTYVVIGMAVGYLLGKTHHVGWLGSVGITVLVTVTLTFPTSWILESRSKR